MTPIEFKSLINKNFTSKMLENGWYGTFNNFKKTDGQYLIKTFGITKYLKQDLFFTTLGLDFDIYHDYPLKKNISLNESNCLFTNSITPTLVTDTMYEWELKDDLSYNTQLLETLWLAIQSHGESFYKNFEDFPKPFDSIMPSEFEYDKQVKLLDTYYVSNQVGFMHLLRNVHLLLENNTVAKQFSEIAISRLQKSMESKSKVLSKGIEKELKKWIKALEI